MGSYTFSLTILAALIVTGCTAGAGPSSGPAEQPRPAGPKIITLAHQEFPAMLTAYGRPTAIGTNDTERWFVFHANLTAFDINGNSVPQLAQKVPTTQDGDWKVNPDGTMDVTWKLRPGAVWHDGTPLTAEDFAFGYELVTNRALAVPELGEVLNISAVHAVDPQTIAVSWKTISITGGHNGVVGFPAIPRHKIGDVYRTGDKVALEATPAWGSEWVGLGPFRLSVWEQGSHIEAQAFEQYALGRPKIDRLIIRFIGDVNVIVANLLAGAIDLAPLGVQLKPDQAAELQRSWQGGETYTSSNALRILHLNLRDPGVPWADLRVRQALVHAMNRPQYVEALAFGMTEIGNYVVMPDDPIARLADQRGVAKYAYDPARAQRLFADAGWTRGGDGLLRNSAGQTMHLRCCRLATADSNDLRESLAVGSDFQAVGVQAEHPLPAAPAGTTSVETRRFQALNKEGNLGPYRFNERGSFASIISGQIPGDDNGWTGSNAGAWSNSSYDRNFAEMMRTLDLTPRQELGFQLVKLVADELPILIMYYSPIGVAVSNRITGINRKPHAPPLTQNTTWNVHQWDVK